MANGQWLMAYGNTGGSRSCGTEDGACVSLALRRLPPSALDMRMRGHARAHGTPMGPSTVPPIETGRRASMPRNSAESQEKSDLPQSFNAKNAILALKLCGK